MRAGTKRVGDSVRTSSPFEADILSAAEASRPPRLDWIALRKLHESGVGLHAASPAELAARPAGRQRGAGEDSVSFCVLCGEQPDKLRVCKACRCVMYCSRTCQIVDWKFGGHRKVCKGKKGKRGKGKGKGEGKGGGSGGV